MSEQNENTVEDTKETTTGNSGNESHDGQDAALGDAGKRALDAERRARKEADRRIAEYEKKLNDARKQIESFEDANRNEAEKREHKLQKTQEQLEAKTRELEAANRQLLTARIAAEYGLPQDMASRLQGKTEEEIREDAEKLQELLGTHSVRIPVPVHQEGKGSGNSRTPGQSFADAVGPLLN